MVVISRFKQRSRPMSETDTYKIVEIAGTSPDGVTEAMRSGVNRAAKTLRHVDWVEVRNIRGHVEGGEIAHFQVEMKIGFKLEAESDQPISLLDVVSDPLEADPARPLHPNHDG